MSVQMRVHCLRTGVLILGPKRTRRSRGNPAPNLNKIRQVKDKPNSTIQMSAADIFICLDWSCVCVRVCVCVCVCCLHMGSAFEFVMSNFGLLILENVRAGPEKKILLPVATADDKFPPRGRASCRAPFHHHAGHLAMA